MNKSLRRDAPELWQDIVSWCREIGIDWHEDEIANVIGKINARAPDDLPDTIGRVLEWCNTAERSGDKEAVATVSLWRQLPSDVITITLSEDGGLLHQIASQADKDVQQ